MIDQITNGEGNDHRGDRSDQHRRRTNQIYCAGHEGEIVAIGEGSCSGSCFGSGSGSRGESKSNDRLLLRGGSESSPLLRLWECAEGGIRGGKAIVVKGERFRLLRRLLWNGSQRLLWNRTEEAETIAEQEILIIHSNYLIKLII